MSNCNSQQFPDIASITLLDNTATYATTSAHEIERFEAELGDARNEANKEVSALPRRQNDIVTFNQTMVEKSGLRIRSSSLSSPTQQAIYQTVLGRISAKSHEQVSLALCISNVQSEILSKSYLIPSFSGMSLKPSKESHTSPSCNPINSFGLISGDEDLLVVHAPFPENPLVNIVDSSILQHHELTSFDSHRKMTYSRAQPLDTPARPKSALFSLHSDDYYGLDFTLRETPSSKFESYTANLPDTLSEIADEQDDRVVDIQQDLLMSGLSHNIYENQVPQTPDISPLHAFKKPINPLNTSNIDYSEIFDADSLTISPTPRQWRIENLTPILQPSPDQYCISDCYILLAFTDDDIPQIWSWIGPASEMDKKFCCALYAVALRDCLATECRIMRIDDMNDDTDETISFLKALEQNSTVFSYLGVATQSALYAADSPRFDTPLRLYKVVPHNKDIRLILVEPCFDSLSSSCVYLLDYGVEMYEWIGRDSSLQHASKLRMVIGRINHLERLGRAIVEEVNQGFESNRFYDLLDVDQSDTEIFEEAAAVMYRVTITVPEDIADNIVLPSATAADSKKYLNGKAGSVASLVHHPVYSKLDFTPTECFVLDYGSAKILVWSCGHPQCIVPLRKRPSWLGLQKMQQGCETELFRIRFPEWQALGEIDWQHVRNGDNILSQQAPSSALRVDVTALYNMAANPVPPDLESLQQKSESFKNSLHSFTSFIFQKGRFVTLPEEERGHLSNEDTYIFMCVTRISQQMTTLQSDSSTKLDSVTSRHLSSQTTIPIKAKGHLSSRTNLESHPKSTLVRLSSISRGNSLNKRPRSSVLDNRLSANNLREETRYSISLANASRASIYSNRSSLESLASSTIDLTCGISRKSTQISSRSIDDLTSSRASNLAASDDDKMACSIYVWSGNNSAKIALLTFKFATLVEMQSLIQSMYACPLNVLYCDSGKEPIELLACLDLEIVVHPCRPFNNTHERAAATFYRFWMDLWTGCVRGVYCAREDLCDPRFVYLGSGFCWVGHSSLGMVNFHTLCEHVSLHRFPNSALNIIHQDHEPMEFVQTFGDGKGLKQYPKGSIRFLKCSCSRGYFMVEQVDHFAQCDLSRDSCVIIDAGREYGCFLWVGVESSDVVLKLSRKSLQVWFLQLQDGRTIGRRKAHPLGAGFAEGDVWVVQESHEPLSFKRLFSGWAN